jgi:UDP-N-acetylmuramoyl-tripeptide--D-alanyl-D-alanine ligase
MTKCPQALWTSEEVMQATGGETSGHWQSVGISIDSRTIDPGDLFIAIVGPNSDGHQYVANALQKGAVGAVIDQPRFFLTSDIENAKLLYVENTMTATQNLAQFARDRTAAKVIAITGSVGKTGSKEMLKLVLSEQGQTTGTLGNLNNHWGLPLSLARMPKKSEFGVFEMGMSHAGEIIPLTKMARPDVALVTTVELAHSQFFNSIEDIADAKSEIFEGIEPSGTVILNNDNPMFGHLYDAAIKCGISDIRTFGSQDNADCRLVGAELGADGSSVEIELHGKKIKFRIGVPGRHWVQNALGVLCSVDAVGADPEMASQKLSDMRGLQGRGRQHVLSISGGTFMMIDESYNASPSSMNAAIDVLGNIRVDGCGRKIAVLGDMLELGPQAEAIHEELVEILIKNEIDLVFATGQNMSALWAALPSQMRGCYTLNAQKISPLVLSVVHPGDVLMIKGSLGSNVGLIVQDFLKLECDLDDDKPTRQMLSKNKEGCHAL